MMKMLPIAKIAGMIGLHRRTVLKMLQQSGVPVYRVGQRKLVAREADILEWLERRKIQSNINEEARNDEQLVE